MAGKENKEEIEIIYGSYGNAPIKNTGTIEKQSSITFNIKM
jgi:hypothetical protein